MKAQSKISVIVPVYNMQQLLDRCITSIVSNTYENLEIICVDDGSKDDSPLILDEWAKKDSRIKVLHKENEGLSEARNSGLQICKGDFVAFIDSDDWIREDYFEVMMDAMEHNEVQMVIGGYVRTADDRALDAVSKERRPAKVGALEFSGNRGYVWGRLYRRELIGELRFDKNYKIEDLEFNLRVLVQNPDVKVAYLSDIIYAYYVREGSLVSNIEAADMEQIVEVLEKYMLRFEGTGMESFFAQESIKRCCYIRWYYWAKKDKEGYTRCQKKLSNARKHLGADGKKMSIIARSNRIYRFWRILNDPSMKAWERSVRNGTGHF
ncbi:MAG: glycosyltransferase [Eubacterium sp.]|nr:glycosyltransferase [Eubacterium sp.]